MTPEVSFRVDQELTHSRVPQTRGVSEGCAAEVVSALDVDREDGAVSEQKLDHRHVVSLGGNLQESSTVRLPLVLRAFTPVSTERENVFTCFDVTSLHCVYHFRFGLFTK